MNKINPRIFITLSADDSSDVAHCELLDELVQQASLSAGHGLWVRGVDCSNSFPAGSIGAGLGLWAMTVEFCKQLKQGKTLPDIQDGLQVELRHECRAMSEVVISTFYEPSPYRTDLLLAHRFLKILEIAEEFEENVEAIENPPLERILRKVMRSLRTVIIPLRRQ
ncbi:hypothetical protein CASFOL_042589 [Castilleja foliolosa]|uniref:Uncharacterized protein n=1 Tax=Castilleja foliolosa TaxID=1961234 RepID=A0ABD3B9G4_9LAMI